MINIYKTKNYKKIINKEQAYNPNYKTHGIKINNHILICGPTSSGKSNFITNLLRQ